jgi:hypothetical protein
MTKNRMRGDTLSLILAFFCGGLAEWASSRHPPLPLAAQAAALLTAMALLWGATEPYRKSDPRRWGVVGNVVLLAWAFVWLLFARIVQQAMGWR